MTVAGPAISKSEVVTLKQPERSQPASCWPVPGPLGRDPLSPLSNRNGGIDLSHPRPLQPQGVGYHRYRAEGHRQSSQNRVEEPLLPEEKLQPRRHAPHRGKHRVEDPGGHRNQQNVIEKACPSAGPEPPGLFAPGRFLIRLQPQGVGATNRAEGHRQSSQNRVEGTVMLPEELLIKLKADSSPAGTPPIAANTG